MPYRSINDIPSQVKQALSEHQQHVWLAAFNNALKEYKDESRAFAVAWAAAKKAHKTKPAT